MKYKFKDLPKKYHPIAEDVCERRIIYNYQHNAKYTPYTWLASFPEKDGKVFNYGGELYFCDVYGLKPDYGDNEWKMYDTHLVGIPNVEDGATADIKNTLLYKPLVVKDKDLKDQDWPDYYVLTYGKVDNHKNPRKLFLSYCVVGYQLGSVVRQNKYYTTELFHPCWVYPVGELLELPNPEGVQLDFFGGI